MNWKLIFGLSLFGLAMAFATVYFIPASTEIFCWLAILLICAYIIAKNAPGRYFLHGFMVSLINCVWIVAVHMMLSSPYLANHADEAQQYAKLNDQFHVTPQQAMLIVGPIIGVVSGIILGLFSWIASLIFKKKPVVA